MSKKQHRVSTILIFTLILAMALVGLAGLDPASPADASGIYLMDRYRFGFGLASRYGGLNEYPNSLAQLNAGWYTDYWWSANPPRPNGIEYVQLLYIENFGWTRYEKADGLASNVVNAIAPESSSRVWFGTPEGLSELNNFAWTTYTTTLGLVNDNVLSLAIDGAGHKWIGTSGGVSRYNGTSFTNYTTSNTPNLAGNTVYAIAFQANNNTVWFATNGGISRYTVANNSWTKWTTAQGLASNTVLSVAVDGVGHKWFGTTAGVSRFDGNTFTNYTTTHGLISNRVQAVAIHGNTKWFGTDSGLSAFNGTTWVNYNTSNANGLMSNDVRALAMDGLGNLWCGTMRGVSKYDGTRWSGYPAYAPPTVNLGSGWVYAVAIDPGQRKWFGGDNGGASVLNDAWAWTLLGTALDAQPGSLWIIGNEPDGPQDVATPPIYAQRYHEFYTFIKGRDPTAQVAVAGIVQATPLRMQWLNDMAQEYQARYGTFIPVDVWNIHEQILREKYNPPANWGCKTPLQSVTYDFWTGSTYITRTGELPLYCKNTSGQVEYCRYDQYGQVAAGQTRINSNTDYDGSPLYETWDNANFDLFREHILRYRQWMKNNGQQNKPLIISEYGVMMPGSYLLPPGDETAHQFMRDTFDYMLDTIDANLGYPADDYRLVQRWAWFSLNSNPDMLQGGYNGTLVYDSDWDTRHDELTPFGEIFAEYTTATDMAYFQYAYRLGSGAEGLTISGGGDWYLVGTTAKTPTAPASFVLGGITYTWQGWYVDGLYKDGNPIEVLMDGPHTAISLYLPTP